MTKANTKSCSEEEDSFIEEGLIERIPYGNIYHINIDSDIEEASRYRSIFSTLRRATPSDGIVFHINTYGGYVDTTLKFYQEMQMTDAHTTAVVTNAMSAGTMIMLFCDELVFQKHCKVMIHSVSGGSWGKHNEINSHVEFNKEYFEGLFRDWYKGFLTKGEISKVLRGEDMWLGQKECEERAIKRVKIS
jgi:ATP-dependent protease ClpP protease subunit